MSTNHTKIIGTLLPAVIILTAGCKTIVREDIIVSIDTGVGATIAENKQTQSYELKAGYIRNQFYSIPTGKLVENDNSAAETAVVTDPNRRPTHAKISNAANVTPQLVSGIRAHSGLGDLLLGMDVSENFAIGDVAVTSQAAIAMYITTAVTASNATAAAEAIKAYAALTDPNLLADQKTLDVLLAKNLQTGKTIQGYNSGNSYNANQTQQYADDWAAKNKNSTVGTIRRKGGHDLNELIIELKSVTIP
jgi:hypothetical protein